MSTREVVNVHREKLTSCMTCPLCNRLFRHAITISECLHTFCRECIYEKIHEEELDCCPVCNTELGCSPLEKLRVDHTLQDLGNKIFLRKRHLVKAPNPVLLDSKVEPVEPLPGKTKEKTLSSFLDSSPIVCPKQPSKRLKVIARKGPTFQESVVRIEGTVNTVESSKSLMPAKAKEEDDLLTPLHCLVETASNTKSSPPEKEECLVKANVKRCQSKSTADGVVVEEQLKVKDKVMENGNDVKGIDDRNDDTALPSSAVKTRRRYSIRTKKATVAQDLNGADVWKTMECVGRFSPIWFSLIASIDQKEDVCLPQISSHYLRVKDGSLPISTIKTYLVKKLGLTSEAEVELSLHGQPLLATMQLHDLVSWWLKTAPAATKRIKAKVGSFAEDYLMVLSYHRKANPS